MTTTTERRLLKFVPIAQPGSVPGVVGSIEIEAAAAAAREARDLRAKSRYGHSIVDLLHSLEEVTIERTDRVRRCSVDRDRPNIGQGTCDVVATACHTESGHTVHRCGMHVGYDPDKPPGAPHPHYTAYIPVPPGL